MLTHYGPSCQLNLQQDPSPEVSPRFIMLGGFLGAGKTTTILRMAQYFQKMGKRVGLITNDQAAGLVDTALLEELDLPVREIAGGCFCCKSEGLVEALARLTADAKPEIFIAEPVGSCTDLIATVSLPLERIYHQAYQMAPYAVLVDPYRAMQTLGVEGSPLFSPDVNYIYRKQLEEAEIIVINKVDVMNKERLARLRAALETHYPDAKVLEIASRSGLGMEPLIETMAAKTGHVTKIMDVDYQRYGVGEALLGWVNVQAKLELTRKGGPLKTGLFNRNEWLTKLCEHIQKSLKRKKIEVAHLKVSLAGQNRDLSAVQLTRSGGTPELTRSSDLEFGGGDLLINLRAEGDPDTLLAAVMKAMTTCVEEMPALRISHLHTEHFRPGQPVPTHRVSQ